jgi:hypothetical protein
MSRKPVAFIIGLVLLVLVLAGNAPGIAAQTTTLHINEILVGNASTNLDPDLFNYGSWIEIYNAGSSAVDLRNYSLAYLDFGATTPLVWKVSTSVSVPAGGYVLLWADEGNKGRHASFDLDMRGSEIKLLNPSNGVVDSVTYDMRANNVLLPDIAYVLNLTPAWQVFQVEFTTRGFTSPTSDSRLRLWLAPYDQNGAVYEFDDVVLVEK